MSHEAPRDVERGAGTVGTASGFLVFLLLMFVAVQVLFNLYATTMVTTAAHDAARHVAGFGAAADRCGAVSDADAAFVERLGAYGDAGHANLDWTCTDPDVVVVRVRATHPSVLPTRFGALASLAALDRTIVVRVEADR